jgi:hypothetical protein
MDGNKLSLNQNSVWFPVLLLSIATTLVTVSVFELLKLALEWTRSYISTRMAFNRFWGDGASTSGNNGVILLQEENIEETVKGFAPSVSFAEPTIGETQNRFFKAITWVNKWDAEAAKHIRSAFWIPGYRPPEMQHIRGSESYTALPNTPFVVAVGLFSEQTKGFVQDYSGDKKLIKIVQTKDGDALEIFRGLVNVPQSLQVAGSEMLQLTPKLWNRDGWTKDASTTDFAMILRHTQLRSDSTRLVRFVVAGFTEQGTEAAGRYLAKQWLALYRRFWNGSASNDRRGDFFIVIVGKSNNTKDWAEDPGLNPITPGTIMKTYRELVPPPSGS